MRINPLLFQYYKPNPNFGSNSREVHDKEGGLMYRNTTVFFRPDLNWNKFGDYIAEKYKDADKVNVVCYACSDGSEPLSILMLLKERLKDDYKKFTPIIAKDIDQSMINSARGEFINMDYYDFKAINELTGNKYDDYFVAPKLGFAIGSVEVRKRQPLLKDINFSVADITEDIENIPSKNTILFCRNFWPYLESAQERVRVMENISSRLKDNCILVIGDFDLESGVEQIIPALGFQEVSRLGHVYESNTIADLAERYQLKILRS